MFRHFTRIRAMKKIVCGKSLRYNQIIEYSVNCIQISPNLAIFTQFQ